MQAPKAATVVLPAYEDEAAMPIVIRDLAVAAYALRSRGIELDVLLLDGGTDQAGPVAEKVAADLGLALRTVPGPASGPGHAFLEGFRHVLDEGRADLIVTLDANGRHDATQIPHLIDQVTERGLDVVIGSRWVRGSGTPGLSPSRWVLGRLANATFRLLTGTRGIADATTSFRVARAEVVRDLDFEGLPVSSHSVQTFFIAMAVAQGYRVGEGPIIYRPAVAGGSGLRSHDVSAFAGHLRALHARVDRARQRRLSPGGRSFTDEHFGAADDLERLGTSKHFFDWVLDEFHPYLNGRVLEVGAGTGTITRKLVERYPELRVVALEPAANVWQDLRSFAAFASQVEAHQLRLDEYQQSHEGNFDAVLYINVLEHIAEDEREVELAADALRPGGFLLVFGPALEWLYSDLDYKAGHYRRYSRAQLRGLVQRARLDPVSIRYFDVLGVWPYYLVYRLLRSSNISGSTMWGYDRLVVPLSRLLQQLLRRPPVGKNFILVARKP